MRRKCKNILRRIFHAHLIRTRSELAWTQAEMARVLEMDERSFVDLDHGKSSCSGLTLALYLSYCCDNPLQFLEDFKSAYEKETKVAL